MTQTKQKQSMVQTWFWIVSLILLIVFVGVLTFTVVADKGMPPWDYGTVKFLPSESPYATYQKLPFPQHIRGKGGN
ncbi:MAG: hypothetical protein ABIK68_24170 [bacterium]